MGMSDDPELVLDTRRAHQRKNACSTLPFQFSAYTCVKCALILSTAWGFATTSVAQGLNNGIGLGTKDNPTIGIPFIDQTNSCSDTVFIENLIKGATVKIWLRRAEQQSAVVFNGIVSNYFGSGAAQLSESLKAGDVLWAEETYGAAPNTTTSNRSATMTVGAMPDHLAAPSITFPVYQCAAAVTVSGLTPGVWVELNNPKLHERGVPGGPGRRPNLGDIGWGSTPGALGSTKSSILVSPEALSSTASSVRARQVACSARSADAQIVSDWSPISPVLADPSPLPSPILGPSIVGSDTIGIAGVSVGALLDVYQGEPPDASNRIFQNYAPAPSGVVPVSPSIKAALNPTATQTLCKTSPIATGPTPSKDLPPIELVGPICVESDHVTLKYTTPGAYLALFWNTHNITTISASPGDVRINIPKNISVSVGDRLVVEEVLGEASVHSNVIVAGCTNVSTYHNDNARTGWNSAEYTLTPDNVTPGQFGLIHTVVLGEQDAKLPQYDIATQVDAQPLILTNQLINGTIYNSVVYVATEGNVVYAIDGWTGDIILHRSLGTPWKPPSNCHNNAAYIGVNSTPTIDIASNTLYVMADLADGDGNASWRLFALDLGTLEDHHEPLAVSSTRPYGLANTPDVVTYFNPNFQRQRVALLELNQNIYVGFASYCDNNLNSPVSQTRGWLFGFSGGGTEQMNGYTLTDKESPRSFPPETNNYYLSTIWMSGFGPAADADGNIYVVTGNSDSQSRTYTGWSNLQESVARIGSVFLDIQGVFTPKNWFELDKIDGDFGAGGITLLPAEPEPSSATHIPVPHLAVAAGKDGNMYFLDVDNLTNPSTLIPPSFPGTPNDFANGVEGGLVQTVQIGNCHCGASYYKGSDNLGRVISSGGGQVMSWVIRAVVGSTGTGVAPIAEATSQSLDSNGWSYNGIGTDGGFFTSISSNGESEYSTIVWAVGHDVNITLYAFNAPPAGPLVTLWSKSAGQWGESIGGAHPNIVPTVANGRVYVASGGELEVFGLTAGLNLQPANQSYKVAKSVSPGIEDAIGPLLWGKLMSSDSGHATLRLRDGGVLQVDTSETEKTGMQPVLVIGQNFAVNGSLDPSGVLHAHSVAKVGEIDTWLPDRRY
jgi:hypothetical protein